MYLAKNLQYLRKKFKLTQEELAERLNVSRQAISKWETQEGYPEMDKLLLIGDIFHIAVDDLLRKQIDVEEVEDFPIKRNEEFIKTINHFSLAISMGVFLIILGVSLCVFINGFGFYGDTDLAELLGILSGVIVIVFVAIAVFLFVFFGMSYEHYRKANPVMEIQYSKEEAQSYQKKFIIWMSCLVSGILIDVIFLILCTSFIDKNIINVQNKESFICFITAIFLFVLACIVGKLVHLGISNQKVHVGEYNKQNKVDTSFKGKLKSALCGAIMMLATIVFLLLGFGWNLWHPGWICFPIGGILCGILSSLLEISPVKE